MMPWPPFYALWQRPTTSITFSSNAIFTMAPLHSCPCLNMWQRSTGHCQSQKHGGYGFPWCADLQTGISDFGLTFALCRLSSMTNNNVICILSDTYMNFPGLCVVLFWIATPIIHMTCPFQDDFPFRFSIPNIMLKFHPRTPACQE